MTVAVSAMGWISPVFREWADFLCADSIVTTPPADWFIPEQYLGKRGHKYLSDATRFLLASSVRAMETAGDLSVYDPCRLGVVIGTNQADYWVRKNFDRTIRGEGAGGLSTVQAPNASVSLPASYLAMRNVWTGPNLTLTNPFSGGVESLHVARRFMVRGLADAMFCGAAEDRPSRSAAPPAMNPEGACLLLLEQQAQIVRRGGRVFGLLADSSLHFSPDPAPAMLARLVGPAIDRYLSDAEPSAEVWVVSSCESGGAAFAEALTRDCRYRVNCLPSRIRRLHGGHTLLPLLQVLWLLANRRIGVMAIVSPSGQVVLLNFASVAEVGT